MSGLSQTEAEKRRREYGPNALVQTKPPGAFRIFFSQFRDAMVLILLAATGISALLGEWTDAVTIIVIVLLNAILGFIQEYRTEKTLEALRNMTAPAARVCRDGKWQEIPAEQLVPGDVISVEAGDCVPADCLLTAASRLYANESVLTGEAEPIPKQNGSPGLPTDGLHRNYLLYSGTAVTRGTGTAVVTATGKNTQMGQISGMLSSIQRTQTPLQKRLGELGRVLAILCLAVCAAVFAAGVLRGEPVFDMLMTGISIAIAAIPEGLPATVTIALALAVNRMMAQKALVNRLHSVETLGCTSVICSDKTGTITENRMTVTEIATLEQHFSVGSGDICEKGTPCHPASVPALAHLLQCAVLCNNGRLTPSGSGWETVGDPTETALLEAAAKGGISDKTLSGYTRRGEEPFDSDTRCMSVLVQNGGTSMIFAKGAGDVILAKCSHIRTNAGVLPLTAEHRRQIREKTEQLSAKALRVLAFAEKSGVTGLSDGEQGMTFLGITGMLDPPRAEAKAAIRTCRTAGVRTVMITGDHKKTAEAIAKQAGLLRGGEVVTGDELDLLSDSQLDRKLPKISVFARVNPSHKLRLVRAFKRSGAVVTMTGDGVNDAPAIKEADVGVAMGMTGTDVAKQAADVILMDDNLATLVSAVEQGRCIYANIRKFVRYLLSCNIGEVITMFLGILMGMPVVLLPVQLLLVNLATDGLPAIALGLEPPDRDIMRKAPRRPEESFFADGLLGKIVWRGIMIGLCTLASFSTALRFGGSLPEARTAALVTLVMSQLIHVFECKSEHGTIFSVRYFSNPKLILAVLLSAGMLAATIWIPGLQVIFSTAPLYGNILWQALGFSFAVPVITSIFTKRK